MTHVFRQDEKLPAALPNYIVGSSSKPMGGYTFEFNYITKVTIGNILN